MLPLETLRNGTLKYEYVVKAQFLPKGRGDATRRDVF